MATPESLLYMYIVVSRGCSSELVVNGGTMHCTVVVNIML